jgi:flagellar M-ring protein FliF
MNSLMDSLTGRLGNGRQIAIIAVGVITTALVFGISRWATQPTMVQLYADVPVENVKAMTDKLQEAGIVYQLDAAGTTILVESADLARARVDLAAGEIPNAGRPGMELFDKPTWGMTDFTQKVNYGRALEGELERTIGKMKDVKAVQVHLALEDDQLFKANERQSKASVTLSMTNGQPPRAETVRGIASLVANSVGGLEPSNVAVIDERGAALTMDDDGSMAGLSSRQLSVQREVEGYMQKKADELLTSLVGPGNARVQVAASINFDKVERTVQAVDPDKQALAAEQKAEVVPGTPQQGAGYTTSSTSFENSKSVESFSGAIGNVKKLSVAVLVADKVTMPVLDTTQKNAAPVAPTVTPRTPEELTRIEALVRNALGVDSTRGDMISVVSAPFDIPAPVTAKADTAVAPLGILEKVQKNPKPVVAIAALLALLVIAVVMVVALKPKKNAAPSQAALPAGGGYPELPSSAQMQAALQAGMQQGMPTGFEGGIDSTAYQQQLMEENRRTMLPPPPTTPEREQAIATVEQRPDAAVRVMRSWLRS